MNGSMCIAPSDDISSYQMIGLIALISYCGITKLKKEKKTGLSSCAIYIVSSYKSYIDARLCYDMKHDNYNVLRLQTIQ
jgi:hypothetical protein